METQERRKPDKRIGGGRQITHRMLMASVLAVLIAVRLGGGVVSASPAPDGCVAAAATLGEARADYAATCDEPRVDCDKIDGLWYCSSEVIGDNAPGGVTPDNPVPPPATPPPEPTAPTNPTAPTPDPDAACVAVAATLGEARADYAATCDEPRVDCDKIDGLWYCSSEVIGDSAPGMPGGNPDDGYVPVDPEPTEPPVEPTPVPPVDPTPEPTVPPVEPTPVPPVDPTPVPPVEPTPVPPVEPTPVPTEPPLDGLHPDIVKVIEVEGRNPGGFGWKDSYSVGDKCFCATTYDHNIRNIEVDTPAGTKTVEQVCDALGPGPGPQGRPIYNDVQCGNGPANDAGDEDDCPGRVDIGREGCGQIGPVWDLSIFE